MKQRFIWEGTVTSFFRHTYLVRGYVPRPDSVASLIGARDNNVGGSDVSSCHAESVAVEFAPPRS